MRYAPDMGERIQRGADLTRRLSEALAAEESGLIVPLGRWVLHGACRQAGIWRHDHPAAADQVMSVNVAGRQLREPGFLAEVSDALAAADLPARCLWEAAASAGTAVRALAGPARPREPRLG